MKVAQYEVLGNEAKRQVRLVGDDRNTRLLISHAAQRLPAFVDRPVRDGYSLKKLTQHFVLGYFRQVPAGLIFSDHHRTCAILIATSYVDAHGRLPDPVSSLARCEPRRPRRLYTLNRPEPQSPSLRSRLNDDQRKVRIPPAEPGTRNQEPGTRSQEPRSLQPFLAIGYRDDHRLAVGCPRSTT